MARIIEIIDLDDGMINFDIDNDKSESDNVGKDVISLVQDGKLPFINQSTSVSTSEFRSPHNPNSLFPLAEDGKIFHIKKFKSTVCSSVCPSAETLPHSSRWFRFL